MLRRVATEWCRALGVQTQASAARSLAVASHLATSRRPFSSAGGKTIDNFKEEIDQINDLFVEARDEIEYAHEDAGTTYFNDSAQQARDVVAAVVAKFEGVLEQLSEEERGRMHRSMGMKMEQLKAELQQLDTLHD